MSRARSRFECPKVPKARKYETRKDNIGYDCASSPMVRCVHSLQEFAQAKDMGLAQNFRERDDEGTDLTTRSAMQCAQAFCSCSFGDARASRTCKR